MNKIICRILIMEIGRRIEMQLLMNIVTSALRLPRRNLLCMPSDQSLDIFATLTAERLASCNDEQQQRLYSKAFRLGRTLRHCLSSRDAEALTSLTFLLYRNIGIDMQGRFPGKVIVSRCHFSRHYTPHVCNIASLMDSGVVCGLFGGGRLAFRGRISEGEKCCVCELTKQ